MALISFVLLCGVLILCQNVYSAVDSNSFCYEDNRTCGPVNWPGTCQTGKRQSPIDIPLTSSHLESATRRHLFVSKSYNREYHRFTLKNTGHTARLETASDEESKMSFSGPLFNHKNYTFAYLDFHWGLSDDDGSEHSLNGKRYAMEAQLVHYRSDFDNVTQALASQERHALTIVAVFYNISYHNMLISEVTGSLQEIKNKGKSTEISHFVLSFVLEYQMKSVVLQYDGSLTTPDCNESVLWNVLSGVEPISLAQLKEFRKLNDNEGKDHRRNNRPLQQTKKRIIQYFIPAAVQPDFE